MTMSSAREAQGRGPGRGPGRGRGRGRQIDPPATTTEELRAWFAGNLPDDWFTEPPTVEFDRDEIVVTGQLTMPKLAKNDAKEVAARARIEAFREDTRAQRITIAERAQATFLRRVSWAATCGDEHTDFTRGSVPVMTRLHLEQRQVLDTLIDAGVARSRSEALAWAVHLVGENEAEWIDKLREAMTDLEALREKGPDSRS